MDRARRTVISWALYDFANSAFTTLVVTFIFSAYFTQRIASDVAHGTVLWTHAVNASSIIVALSMPVIGAMADYSGRKKEFLFVSTLACAAFTALLFTCGPGSTVRAVIVFTIANVAFEAANVFYNAFLPEVSNDETIGRVSGVGWALGYGGGLVCLVIALGMIRGWVPSEGDLHVRSTNLLVAGWYLVFSIPMFVFVKEEVPEARASVIRVTIEGFRRFSTTVGHLRVYRQAAKLLLARLVYNDGLVTVFSFAAIFAAAAFGMKTDEIIVLGIAINVTAGLGAWGFGYLDDRIGGKKTIAITLVVLIGSTLVGAFARSRGVFWISALVLGAMVGPNQSASRSLLGHFVPSDRHAEFFGFFAFSGKLASVLGPLTYGLVLESTGSQRLAMGSIVVFFAVGLALLLVVNEEEGARVAKAASAVGRAG